MTSLLSMAIVVLSLERKPHCSSHSNAMFYGYILVFKMSAGIYIARSYRDSEQHNILGYITHRSCRDFVVVSFNCAFPHGEQATFYFLLFISNCLYFQIIFGAIIKYGVTLESGELLNFNYNLCNFMSLFPCLSSRSGNIYNAFMYISVFLRLISTSELSAGFQFRFTCKCPNETCQRIR
jgi:hypothetical protein